MDVFVFVRNPFYLLGNVKKKTKNRIAHPAMTGWPPCRLTFQAQIIQDGLTAASVGTVLRPESADTPASWLPAKRRPLLTSGSLSYFVAHVPQLDKWELKRRRGKKNKEGTEKNNKKRKRKRRADSETSRVGGAHGGRNYRLSRGTNSV